MKLTIDIREGAPTYADLLNGLTVSLSIRGLMYKPVAAGDGGAMAHATCLADWTVESVTEEEPPTFTPPHTPNPLDHECPVCGALVGKYCNVPGSRGRRQVPWVHPVREELAQTQNGESNA